MSYPTKRNFTQEFKLEAITLVTEEGYTRAAAAEAVGINYKLMAKWVKAYKDSRGSESNPD